MEQELLTILNQTLQTAEEPRRAAEAQLEALYSNDSFPVALVNIAAAVQAPLASRQTALTTLKRYVNRCWSPTFEEFSGPLTPPEVRIHLKGQLLGVVTSEQRQVRSIAAAVVGKIATADYPDEWPELLPSLLRLVSEGNDVQTTGALHVLNDVVEEGLGDELFIQLAKDIVELLYKVATAENRSFSVRSLATSTFKSCVDTLGTLQGGNESDVTLFAQEAINLWVPFITKALEAPLPPDEDSYKGMLALKIQAIKTVTQAKIHFVHIFDQSIEKLFAATWSDMNVVKERYVAEFVKDEADGKLVNADGLPYSLDLYVLEQIDFIQTCLGTKIVRDQIEHAGFATAGASPFSQMMFTTLMLSQIGGEDRLMWETDLNVFLSEECAVSANYTPRTACGDLALKLFEYFPDRTLESLSDHTQSVFRLGGDGAYVKEAALYLWDQLLHEVADRDYPVDAGLANGMLQLIVQAMCDDSDAFLRARGYAAAATLTEAAYASITGRVTELMEQSIRAATSDRSPIVQICAIRAFQKYCHSVAGEQLQGYQSGIIAAVRNFLEHKRADDPEDAQDVLAELVETIQAASTINYAAVLDSNLQIPELLFTIASNCITNFHIHGLVQDTFESVTRGLHDSYIPLCEKILPLLIPMLEPKPDNTDHELIDLGTAILSDLIENGTSPLPQGFVANVMPHLTRILSSSSDAEVVSAGTKALTHILTQDAAQLLSYRSPAPESKTGLELTLIIIDRLLRPDLTESTAAEVGSLAAELVDKAGDQLGPLLPELLRAVAARLANAVYPPFVQSLILVFARLVLKQAKDVVDFLSSLNIDNRNGLEVVLAAWLGHTTIFSGYDDIYQNVLALCHLYNLQDPRLSEIQVQGDLIVPESSRIMTRSRAKTNPDRYTSVSVPVKILKLLVQELGPNIGDPNSGGLAGRGLAGVQQKEPEDEDDEWEDMPEALGIPGTGMSREELLALGASGRTSRQADDETFAVLVSFFKEASTKNIGNFHELYKQLTPDEQRTLSQIR